jgi:hypothetical protein
MSNRPINHDMQTEEVLDESTSCVGLPTFPTQEEEQESEDGLPEYIGFGEMMRRKEARGDFDDDYDEPSDDELFPEENLSTDFTHEPNEVVPAKAQAGWEESSESHVKKRQMTDLSSSCIAKKSLKRDLVVSTDGCQETVNTAKF